MNQPSTRTRPAESVPHRPTRDEYLRWSEGQRYRHERVRGEVIRMNAERAGHVQVKMRVWAALDAAIREAGLDCQAFGDGMTVSIGDDTDYEPDAVVNCGPRLGSTVLVAPNPVVVVEVASPSTQSVDLGGKLADYFRVESVRHYLFVLPSRKVVIHHARIGPGRTEATVLEGGPLRLDPPGVVVNVADFFVDLGD